jgi:hypothetical protein
MKKTRQQPGEGVKESKPKRIVPKEAVKASVPRMSRALLSVLFVFIMIEVVLAFWYMHDLFFYFLVSLPVIVVFSGLAVWLDRDEFVPG